MHQCYHSNGTFWKYLYECNLVTLTQFRQQWRWFPLKVLRVYSLNHLITSKEKVDLATFFHAKQLFSKHIFKLLCALYLNWRSWKNYCIVTRRRLPVVFLFWERLRDCSTTNFRAQITSVLPDKYVLKTAILLAFLPNFLQEFTR